MAAVEDFSPEWREKTPAKYARINRSDCFLLKLFLALQK
jgi:hypothetical protein